MYVTSAEREAFVRAQAAGLISPDTPVPENETAAEELIYQVGVMFARTYGCRSRDKRLFFLTAAAFSEEYLDELPKLLPGMNKNVWFVNSLRLDCCCNTLEALTHYFGFGREIVNKDDLSRRLAVNAKGFAPEQILRGFDLPYAPEPRSGLATVEQRSVLSEWILSKRLQTISRRNWENLTEVEAASLICSVPEPPAELPPTVRGALASYERLSAEEKRLFRKLTQQKEPP